MKSILTFLALALLSVGPLQAQDKEALREVVAAFEKIEADHKDWPHYSYSVENLEGGQSFANHVWKSDGDEGFVKVEMLNFDDHGETKTQFYFKGADLLFTLDRSESSLMIPKAPTEVVEKRYYFANKGLIRVLEKKGKFAAGKPADTASLKNQEVPLSELENASETYTIQHELAADVIEKVRRLDGDAALADDAAEVPANGSAGDGWRVIAGSGSRDGTYALAWGLKGQNSAEGEADDDGAISVDAADERLVNYVVNVRTKEIIGKIAGKHFGDKSRYNHNSTESAWSSDSNFVAQVNSGKWETAEARVYEMRDGSAVSKGADLIKPVSTVVFEHLQGREQLKKFAKKDFAISLQDARIVQQAGAVVLQVGVIGQVPKNEDPDASFEMTVSFVLTPGEDGGAPGLRWSSTEGH